ncbi:MAG: NUDIX hydrolase [Candidatus Diapherotrites archaeon]|nr:NUDIX hydrolase [Candidatus Diapherotrites archaeon]
MIYEKEPENFKSKVEIVSCIIEAENEFLMLQRQIHKPEGGKWGLPAGKIDAGEKKEEAILREVFEETGIELEQEKVSYFKKIFVRYPTHDFIYHMFNAKLPKKPEIKIRNEEHLGFKWVTPKESLELETVLDFKPCIKLFFRM